MVLTWLIFAATYVALAVGKVPRLRVDRSGIALIGAVLMLCTGVVSMGEAVSRESIDYDTIFLLFGMMIVVGFMRISGLFDRLANGALRRVHSPRALLGVVILLSGVLSAFLVNDIVCLALAPLVVRLTRRLRYDPIPHLIGLATAANIGSTATVTGNPQNMYIGSHSHVSYAHFAEHLMPIAMLGLLINYGVVLMVYRKALAQERAESGAAVDTAAAANPKPPEDSAPARRVHVRLQIKSLIVVTLCTVLFFLGLPIALVALGAAAVLMLDRIKPQRIYQQVDWSLLVMFIGLFIVVHGFQMRVVSNWKIENWHLLLAHPVDLLSLAAAALSNLVSNVPAVLLFDPLVHAMSAQAQPSAWLALAMSSTLAGNLTLLGSVANLIVVESARRDGVHVSFCEYLKAGIPVTILALALGIAWLQWVHY